MSRRVAAHVGPRVEAGGELPFTIGATMKRREFVEQLGIGSALAAAAGVAVAAQGHEGHRPVSGPLANATVSFGAWPVGTVDAPLDRTTGPALAPLAPNHHALVPFDVTIKEGGSVNFVLAGFHQVVVYAPGKKADDVDETALLPIPGAPPFIGLINDPAGRIYRGVDPRLLSPAPPAAPNLLSQDRVEVVGFSKRGVYLVICAVNVHFAEGMYGWVKVVK
jgi:hypothetical protein